MRKSKKIGYSRVIQNHHITYEPEWTVPVFKGEHWILTQMSRFSRKTISKGFLTALNYFLQENKDRAIEL